MSESASDTKPVKVQGDLENITIGLAIVAERVEAWTPPPGVKVKAKVSGFNDRIAVKVTADSRPEGGATHFFYSSDCDADIPKRLEETAANAYGVAMVPTAEWEAVRARAETAESMIESAAPAVNELRNAAHAVLGSLDYIRNLYGDEGVTASVGERLRNALANVGEM